MTGKKRTGDAGEEAAMQYLIGKGMMLMEKNWRHRHLEVDLIMLAADGVHIVEVKTRTGTSVMEPYQSVTRKKRLFLKKAAAAYISSCSIDRDTHFDIASVIITQEGASVEYIPDAFTQFD